MFSGLIRYRGLVDVGGATLVVRCEGAELERPLPGDSIAIDGVCLTATAVDGDAVAFDVVPETLACSTLGDVYKRQSCGRATTISSFPA